MVAFAREFQELVGAQAEKDGLDLGAVASACEADVRGMKRTQFEISRQFVQ